MQYMNSEPSNHNALAAARQELIQYSADSIRIWFNDQPVNYNPHWHSALEIIVPMENWYDVIISEESFHIVPGDILIISPGELHTLIAPETGKRFIFLFDLSLFAKIRGFAGIQTILSRPLHLTRTTHPNIYDDIYQLLMQIKKEYFRKNEFAELTMYSLLLDMFVRLGTNHLAAVNPFPNMRVYKQKEYMDKFNTVIEYIDSHYMEELNIDDIAASVGFSKYHFSRLFKQYSNYTFCAYITRRRIKVAEEFLTQPDLSITEVALRSGFPSISTFNRVFKQIKGCTPSEYREKNTEFSVPPHLL